MRAVERTPWAVRRSSRHDEMAAIVLAHKELIFPRFTGEVHASVEYPAGPGFCDVFAATIAPPTDRLFRIVEVKTKDEAASAGDTIRQLKWYFRQLRRDANGRDRAERMGLTLVVEDDGVDPAALALFANEGIEVLPVSYFTSGGFASEATQ